MEYAFRVTASVSHYCIDLDSFPKKQPTWSERVCMSNFFQRNIKIFSIISKTGKFTHFFWGLIPFPLTIQNIMVKI